MNRLRVLHVTAHLGGGVGRVLSSVATARRRHHTLIEESFVCLEAAENPQYLERLHQADIPVIVASENPTWESLLAEADIVQLEWWHHPLMAAWMSRQHALSCRLVIWSHTSGLHFPAIPPALVQQPHAFLFTTPLSWSVLPKDVASSTTRLVEVIHSSGGFEDFPLIPRQPSSGPLRLGYLGSLNFAKLHPEILDYLQAIDQPTGPLHCFGDPRSNPALVESAQSGHAAQHLVIRGLTPRPDLAFQEMDLLIYLLNPSHYGTTENALLEAMACGVVPIVLDNPVEKSIVRHGITGFVIKNPDEFKAAVTFLHHHPEERLRMSQAAATDIRRRFALEKTERELASCYAHVMTQPKRQIDLASVTGLTPAHWFLSCAGQYATCFTHNQSASSYPLFLFEPSKSSVFHFLKYFPQDPQLLAWAEQLQHHGPGHPQARPDPPTKGFA